MEESNRRISNIVMVVELLLYRLSDLRPSAYNQNDADKLFQLHTSFAAGPFFITLSLLQLVEVITLKSIANATNSFYLS